MEALYIFKFWKPNPSQKGQDSQPFSSKNIKPGGGDQLEEGDDSFFELELIPGAGPLESYRFEFDPNKKARPFHEPSSDSISKRKVLPIEPGSKPQSPISLLKSAPSLKALTFKKSKSTAKRDSLEDEEEWKLGKYLKLIYRPLYARKEKKVTTRGMMGSPSPSSSPLTVDSSRGKERTASTGGGRIQVACKKLGKNKSSPVGDGAAPAGRRDDSLALHHDGIQGAILHCKKSFNSSRDPSLLSRFACEEHSHFRESPRSSCDVN